MPKNRAGMKQLYEERVEITNHRGTFVIPPESIIGKTDNQPYNLYLENIYGFGRVKDVWEIGTTYTIVSEDSETTVNVLVYIYK